MPQGGISFAQPADLSVVVNQNRMKLRVNRVAIVQELRAEHVVGYLAKQNVLTPEEMRRVCTETQKPVAILLDLLAAKDNRTQWYAHFIHALRHAPVDLEQKRRYRCLVDFLENTIIRFPGKGAATPRPPKQFPRYERLPDIKKGARRAVKTHVACSTPADVSTATQTSTTVCNTTPRQSTIPESSWHSTTPHQPDSASKKTDNIQVAAAELSQPNMTLISGHYHQWVPSPTSNVSRLTDPKDLYISLETTEDTAFHEQIKAEKLVLHRMQQLETLYLMHRLKRLPQGFILCMGDCVTQIVDEVDNHHLYVKYFMQLKHDYNLYIVKDLVGSYTNWLMATKLGDVHKNAELLHRAIKFGLNFFDLLDEMGDYVCAEAIVSVLTLWLMVQPCLETWMPGYLACIRLARIRIQNFRFSEADKSLNRAVQYLNAIKLMSFGQKLVDETEKMVATSWLMHELGHHEAAYHWAYDGLKEIDPENKLGVVNALCNAVECFASTYATKRAYKLAVEAVRQASEYFGRVHPMFIKARLIYVEFANKFCPASEKILKVALDTLKRCELIYHCDNMLLARAHMAVSNAYVAAGKLADNNYMNHASKAQRIAMNCVDGMHPLLAIYSEQIAKCSLIKSRQVPKPLPTPETQAAIKMTQLIYAASELRVAYRLYCTYYGAHSYRAATAQILLTDILTDEGNMAQYLLSSYDEARVMYEDTLSSYENCLRPTSPHLGEFKAKLAGYYYDRGEFNLTLQLLDAIVQPLLKDDNVDAGSVRLQWIEKMFQLYVKAVSDLNDPERLEQITALCNAWHQTTEPLQPYGLTELAQKPVPFAEFQHSFRLWKMVSSKVATSSTDVTEILDPQDTEAPPTDI